MSGMNETPASEDGGDAAEASAPVRPRQFDRAWRRRFLPLGIVLAGLVAFFLTGLDKHLTFDALAESRADLVALVEAHALAVGLGFLAVQTLVSAFSIPAVAVVIVAGGFLFGPAVGTAISVVGQTVGAALLFLAARTALRDVLIKYTGNAVRRFEAGFRENALSYMITLRLMPLFPAWLVNLVPSLLGVPLRIFVLGTAFGVIPCTFVFATVGYGLGSIIDEGKQPGWHLMTAPEVAFPLVGLAIVALTPAAYRLLRRRNNRAA